ncbi:MAG: hypothetical protein J6M44_17410 [Butyrivibrio sp.]|nr:hypothetical protein [Butyrivibrio sp.]
MTKKTVFIDYDGTLAYFLKDKSLEEVAQKGYTLTVPMVESFCTAIDMLMNDDELSGYDFRLLSAVLNEYSVQDKKTMLTKRFGSAFAEKSVFVEYGMSKATYVEGGNILLDDFSFNLHEWERFGGIGIKVYNGINGNNGTWRGYSVHSTATNNVIYATLKGILLSLEKAAA